MKKNIRIKKRNDRIKQLELKLEEGLASDLPNRKEINKIRANLRYYTKMIETLSISLIKTNTRIETQKSALFKLRSNKVAELEFRLRKELTSDSPNRKEINKIRANLRYYTKTIKTPLISLTKTDTQKNEPLRLRSRRFFFTYSDLPWADFLKEQGLKNFERMFKIDRKDFKYLIAEVPYGKGRFHLHAYLEFNSPQGIYSSKNLCLLFNDKGREHEIYPGKYRSVKSKHETSLYALKAAKYRSHLLTNMALPVHIRTYYDKMKKHLTDVLWTRGELEAVDCLNKVYPGRATLGVSKIVDKLSLANDRYKNETAIMKNAIYPIRSYRKLPQLIHAWFRYSWSEGRTLILHGPPGTGKTELAKTLMDSLGLSFHLVKKRLDLRELRPLYHEGIIFDDVDMTEFTVEELDSLFSQHKQFYMRIFYMDVDFSAKMPKIITTTCIEKFLKIKKYMKYGKTIIGREDSWFPSPDESFPSLGENEDFQGRILEEDYERLYIPDIFGMK